MTVFPNFKGLQKNLIVIKIAWALAPPPLEWRNFLTTYTYTCMWHKNIYMYNYNYMWKVIIAMALWAIKTMIIAFIWHTSKRKELYISFGLYRDQDYILNTRISWWESTGLTITIQQLISTHQSIIVYNLRPLCKIMKLWIIHE